MKLTPKQTEFMNDLDSSGLLTRYANSTPAINHAMEFADVADHQRYNNRAAFLMRLIESGAVVVRINQSWNSDG